jgi:quercetin dioxygenase-like cupin family protein
MAVIPAETDTHEMHGTTFTPRVSPSRGSTETSVWEVEIPAGTPGVPHEMTREEILVVLSGRAKVKIDGEGYEAGPGDSIVVPAETTFAIDAVETVRALVVLPVGGMGRVDGQTFTPPWAL